MEKLYFDIESTGPDASEDRIVQLAIKVVNEEGEITLNKSKLYNPGIPISDEAERVHGIKFKDIRDCPAFKEDARKLKKIFEDKIIIVFNGLIFDIPLLLNEFERAGVSLNLSNKVIDVLQIERKLQSNKLVDVYKRYTGKELENAHDALSDINATHVVLEHQMERLMKDMQKYSTKTSVEDALYELSGTENMVDLFGKLKKDEEGYLIYNFGKKCKGKRVVDEEGYAQWMLGEKFPEPVKRLLREELSKKNKQQFSKKPVTSSGKSFLDETPSLNKKGRWSPPISEATTEAMDDLPF